MDEDEAKELHPVTFLDRGEVRTPNKHVKDFRANFQKIEREVEAEPDETPVAKKAARD